MLDAVGTGQTIASASGSRNAYVTFPIGHDGQESRHRDATDSVPVAHQRDHTIGESKA